MLRKLLGTGSVARIVTIKDYFKETHLFGRRAVLALLAILVLCGLLLTRLFYIQVIEHDLYITRSERNRLKLLALPPTRGLIYDRHGVLLADNLTSFNLEVVPEQVQDMDLTLRKLARIVTLREEDLTRFRKLLKRTRRFDAVPLRLRLSEEEVARFAIDRPLFPGVDITTRLLRYYPQGELAAHVVGYVGRIDANDVQRLDAAQYSGTTHVGKIGVEKSYEEQLHGDVGFEQVEANAEGRTLRVIKSRSPLPGQDLRLHLDMRVQAAANAALGEFNGAVVAIEPDSGGVLALVSKPGFDPNLFVNGIDVATYKALQESTARPLYNRALQGTYPPGSTIKPFVGLAGLQLNVTHATRRSYCPGYFTLPGVSRPYRDWKRGGHGAVDLRSAIMESCDVYFYELARDLGIDRLHDFLAHFGFGKKTGIDLPGERAGIAPSRTWKRQTHNQVWYPGETLITGIGQGYTLTTPLQLAAATATIATRGRRYEPRIVRSLQQDGDASTQTLASLAGVNADARHWDSINDAMTAVVHGARGTARRIADAPYKIAGKTGTAQVFSLKKNQRYREKDIPIHLRDHALFIAYAPVESPRIAVAVIVENGGSGGAVGAPIARQILDAYLLNSPRYAH